jgi:phospholipase D1/2
MSLAEVVHDHDATTSRHFGGPGSEHVESLSTHVEHNQVPLTPGGPGPSEGLPTHVADDRILDGLLRDNIGHSTSHHHSFLRSPPDTPASRTGPPRSLSFAYSLSNSPSVPYSGLHIEATYLNPNPSYEHLDHSFSQTSTEFRGVLESFHSRELSVTDRKGKRREIGSVDDGWTVNPIKWFQGSPRGELSRSAVPWKTASLKGKEEVNEEAKGRFVNGVAHDGEPSLLTGKTSLSKRRITVDQSPHTSPQTRKRSSSLPQAVSDGKGSKARWAKLRSLLPNIQTVSPANSSPSSSSAVTSATVNITDEVITGGLSTLMLRLWFDRDEKGHRRVPIFLHRLRIRISDSYHPTEEKRTAFRIECEYANGAARWVVYRQLRDFVSLHTHYTVSNVYNRLGDEIPEFPITSKFDS